MIYVLFNVSCIPLYDLYAFTFLARLAINTSLSFVSAQPMLASAMRPDMFFAGLKQQIYGNFWRICPFQTAQKV